MKLATYFALSLLLTTCLPAVADEIQLPIPNKGWSVKFDSPAFKKLSEKDLPQQYSLVGNADRFNISLFVEPPKCEGGDSKERIYECFNAALKQSPTVVYSTERANTLPKGVMVMYMSQVETGGRTVRAFNVNVLFAQGGKWGDLHVSYVNPERADVDRLIALANSFDIVDAVIMPAIAASATSAP